MRLLQSKALTFKEFIGRELPRYAILSHTWVEDEEVSFQEWQHPTSNTPNKSGYHKVQSTCKQACADGYDWVWIDTCCINKDSSAELSEAINSMYRWYQSASSCYVYMRDVMHSDTLWSDFDKSRWFKRGWTLQELIAPAHLVFFTKDWQKIGEKDELADRISFITGVSKEILRGFSDPRSYTVADKMSWVSERQTTRVEDAAYCLFGIFNCHLPLIYGEGEAAFRRLQEEIIRTCHDHSLFAWTLNPDTVRPETYYTGLLAPSPENFRCGGDYMQWGDVGFPKPYSSDNVGLIISLYLAPAPDASEPDLFLARLNCAPTSYVDYLLIRLKRLKGNMYVRVDPTLPPSLFRNVPADQFEETEVCIPHNIIDYLADGDASRVESLRVSFWEEKIIDRIASVHVEPRSYVVESLRNGCIIRLPFPLSTYQPNDPMGAVTFRLPTTDLPNASFTFLFRYNATADSKRRIWTSLGYQNLQISSWEQFKESVYPKFPKGFHESNYETYENLTLLDGRLIHDVTIV